VFFSYENNEGRYKGSRGRMESTCIYGINERELVKSHFET
jgi:hypothetical protein